MNLNSEQLDMLRGLVSKLPEKAQLDVTRIRCELRDIIDEAGDLGFIAMVLACGELVIEQERKKNG